VNAVKLVRGQIAASSANKWVLACTDPAEFLAALFATWQAGRTPVVPANFQKESIATARAMADGLIDRVYFTHSEEPVKKGDPLDLHTNKVILFTSGSSGAPKRVEKTLFQLDSEVLSLEAQWGEKLKNYPVVSSVPHYHIYGLLFRLLWPVFASRTFVSEDLTAPDRLFSRIRQVGPVVLISSPAHLTRIPSLVDLQDIAPHIACIFSSGSPLPPEAAAQFGKSMNMLPIEVYGSTETGGIGWRQGESLWTPFSSVITRLSVDGTLEVRSPYTEGQDWVRTEDRARIEEDGQFLISGRADQIAKIEGKRVSLDEVAARLNEHPWVETSKIVLLEKIRTTLGAVVVLSKEGRKQQSQLDKIKIVASLKEHLSQWLEPVVMPRAWRFVSHMPMSDRGKTTISGLLSLFADDAIEPVVMAHCKTETTLNVSLFVPSTLSLFKGHFPEFPVLPGIMQIHWAAQLGMRAFNIKGAFSGISKLKFHRVIVPNTELNLQIVAKNSVLEFIYTTTEGVHSSGRIEFNKNR
jgi:acyl-CoA synthetase (AMP-forming)/AMP-acid ligase II/3-hydroxymyristoyl/3-hydroxydecanoyl-(acyl carrier protein) dehydratase